MKKVVKSVPEKPPIWGKSNFIVFLILILCLLCGESFWSRFVRVRITVIIIDNIHTHHYSIREL